MGVMGWIILGLVVVAIAIVLIAWFFERSTNEVALLRTGMGGRRVALDSGVLAIPYFHQISRINMQTLRLDVQCTSESSLITQDKLRVDVGAEFNISVMPDSDSIIRASQTLGKRTFQQEELRALIGGMLIDALRSVAARMGMDELHENRVKFVSDVRELLNEPLHRYGLQLNSVSLTALDQTSFSALDENNAFNAVGMRKLAEVVAKSKKERAEIDANSEVSVRKAAMEASRQRLEIELEERRAEIVQEQEIQTLAAAQLAEVAQRKAQSEMSATQARIDMEGSIERAEIERQQALELVEQQRNITIAAKVQEESRAQADADFARAEATKAAETVTTAKAVAEAQRRAELARISAEAEASAKAAREKIDAEAQRDTAKDKAEAIREVAEAQKMAKISEAEAHRAHIEAENVRSESQVSMELELSRLEALPKIVSEMVKPAEKIKSININQLSGFGSGNGTAEGKDKPVVNQALDSILDMAVQLPAMKKIGEQVGVNLEEGISGVTKDKRSD